MANEDGNRETELQRWLLTRYPEGGSVAEQVKRNGWRRLSVPADHERAIPRQW